MKRNILLLILNVTVCVAAYSQWVSQTSPSVFEARGVHMVTSQLGYIVGSGGIMLKTTNAGATWSALSTGTNDTLRSVYFVDENIGFIVGAQGTIRKTVDGGLTWTAQSSGVTNLLRSVFFVNESVGFACGGGGVILKTPNGGDNWYPQNSGLTNDLINIRFSDVYTGYAASSLSTFLNGNMLKTTDGGVTWNSVYTHTDGFLGLAVFGDAVYAGGGYETIVKSVNGGTTWSQVNPTSTNANHFRSAAFVSADTGYVVGDVGLIYYTTDGGTTWTNQGINTNGVLSVYVVNKDTVFACGTSGTILRFTTPCTPLAPGPVTGDASVCAHDTTAYHISSVQGVNYYKWSVPPGSNIVSGQGDTLIVVIFGTTSGFVSVADSNQCGLSVPTQFSVTVSPTPPVPVITQNMSSLTSSSSAGNQWYLNGNLIPGATAQTYTVTQNGVYRVKVTYTSGCWTMSLPFTVTNVGLADVFPLASALAITPNPVNHNAVLNFALRHPARVGIMIFESVGNKVKETPVELMPEGLQHLELDVASFAPGIYLVRMECDKEVSFTKFVKQ